MAHTPNLKSCPFCGSNKIWNTTDLTSREGIGGSFIYSIRCTECLAEMGHWDPLKVSTGWNRRAEAQN